MESLGFLVEAILWLIDLLCMAADIRSWLRGRGNRIERRAARRAGLPPPPRDHWNRRVILLTLAVGVLTVLLLALRLIR